MDVLSKTFGKVSALASLKNFIGGSGKPNPIKNVLEDPEAYKLEVYFEGEEIVMKVKKRVKTVTKIKTAEKL